MLSNKVLVQRERLYFDKFKYRLVFDMWCAGMTEYRRDIDEFTKDIARRKIENAQAVTRYRLPTWPEVDNVDLGAIAKFIDFREQYHPRQHPATIAGIYSSGNTVRLFTNDLNIIDESFDLGGFNYSLSEVEVMPVEPGVKLFARQPKYKYRTYFKEKRVNQEWKDNLRIFLKNHPEIVPCGAVEKFLTMPFMRYYGSRTANSHFVEYDNHSGIMLLTLCIGGDYLAKHYELKRKE